jgi:FKBP-type peptidyl-prolyl cis-trans isomerase
MASGLVIEDLRIGDGPVCNDPNAGIKVRFKAMLKDGTVFEQTAPGESRDFRLKWTIRGWQDGVPGMRVGGLRRLHVPWSLGYGDREIRAGHVVIPPRSDLVFEVELVGLY